MASLKDTREARNLANRYGLEHCEIAAKYTDEELAKLYNGIGPEAFPKWLRAVLDTLHPSLAPVAFIHDVEWGDSDGTEESFAASNARFKRNGYRVARGLYPWWRLRRWIVMNDARRFGNLCQSFGWKGWRAPYEARVAEESMT